MSVRIKGWSIQLLKMILAGCITIIILSVFIDIYCNSGIHIKNQSGATDYTYEPGRHSTNYSEGFSQLTFDENGFNNAIVPEHIDTLLLGSSHMAALNIYGDESVAYYLNENYGLNAYNLGVSGHTIYRIASNIGTAVDVYAPAQRVIIETDTIQLDSAQMDAVVDESATPIKVYDSGILFWIQKNISSVKFLYKQVGLWKDADYSSPMSAKVDYSEKNYISSLNSFLSKIRSDAGDLDVIIFYHSKTQIDGDGNYVDPTDPDARAAFIAACEANNITFVDMTESFENLYNEERILAHGFANTAVGYGHLNKYGHSIIAEELAKVIQGVEE